MVGYVERLSDVTVLADDEARAQVTLALPDGARATVAGTVLEAAFRTPGGCLLLWLTEDAPYDERLHIHLLDRTGAVLDGIVSSAHFTAGILDIRAVRERSVLFTFYTNEVTYRLDLHPAAPRFLLPRGWRYSGWKIRRYLSIEIAG